jgi:ABC-type transport system involved in multi-copper enzyme maturation permease subunit
MKQLFIKEWREHFKAALLALATLTLLLIVVVWNDLAKSVVMADTNSDIPAEMLQPLVSSDVLGVTAFFCAIFGGLLGWLQIQAEKHPDLRAFLLHRPVERTTIFWSKLLGGTALYAFGAGVPLIGLVIYVLIPGHVPAPFEWAMVQPLINVFLLGLVFYAAGLLTAVRPARWYGSRIFGLGPAALACYFLFVMPQFWQALATIVLAGAMLVAAVWGAFQTGGTWREQPGPGKLALSFACATAGLLLCLLAAALLMEFLFRPATVHYSSYTIAGDGTVYRVVQNGSGPATIEDLNGRPLRDEITGQNLSLQNFYKTESVMVSTSVNFERPRPEDLLEGRRWYCVSTRYFIPWQRTDKTLWYLTRAGRFMAYDLTTRRRVDDQELGAGSGVHFHWPDDFYQNAMPNTFSTDPRQPRLVTSDQTLYRVDGADRTVKTLLAAANEGGLGGYAEGIDQEVLVVTRKFIRVMNLQGVTEWQAPYDPAWPEYQQISLSRLEATNQFALQYYPSYALRQKLPVEVEWVKDGQILRQQKLPPLPEPKMDEHNRLVENCCLLIIPTSLRVGTEEFIHVYSKQEYHFDRWDAYSLIPVGFSILVGWGLGRRLRLSLREQAAWAAFNLIFGIGGVLAFLSVQEWPARERCPQCRKLRRVDREQCEHCGGGFAPPARNGTEIFEPAHGGQGANARSGDGQG